MPDIKTTNKKTMTLSRKASAITIVSLVVVVNAAYSVYSLARDSEPGSAGDVSLKTSTDQAAEIKPVVNDMAAQVYDEEGLNSLTLSAMEAVNSPISGTRRKIVARTLARVALEILSSDEERVYWIAVLGRESKYDGKAKSRTGAVGIGQVMPKFQQDFAKMCGFDDTSPDDVYDDQVNAYLSACYFKALVQKHGGVIPLALAGYNAGPNSQDVKNFSNLGSMNHETANYVSSVWLIANRLQGVSQVQVPE